MTSNKTNRDIFQHPMSICLQYAAEVVVVHIADAEDQLPICPKTVHAALRPDLVATSSAVLCLQGVLM